MSRRLSDLLPAVESVCREFLAHCKSAGIDLIVTSTRRTEAEQLALFAQGREKLSLVNKLRTGAGMPPIQEAQNKIRTYKQCSTHESGLAFDVAIVRAGAAVEYAVKVDVNENEISDYEEIGAIGESLGLRWGGRFKFRDYVHFECLR